MRGKRWRWLDRISGSSWTCKGIAYESLQGEWRRFGSNFGVNAALSYSW